MVHLAVTLLVATAGSAPPVDANLPATINPAPIRRLIVQHDGRWPPLDTLARDIVESVTGDPSYLGRDPVLWLLAWTFDPSTWMQQPVIPIRNADLRHELQLPASQEVFSYAQLVGHKHLLSLIDALSQIEEGRKLDPLESKVSDIHGKLTTLQRAFRGMLIKPIPDPEDTFGAWTEIGAPAGEDSEAVVTLRTQWASLEEAFLADDGAEFSTVSDRLVATANALPAAFRPAPEKIATELRYNELEPFRTAWIVMVCGAVLAALAMWVRQKWFDVVAFLGLLAGFALLSYGLALRWAIAGRIPAANMFESLLFLSWGMGAFAIVAAFALRQRLVPLTASAMGALALVLADCLPVDSFVRPIPPVLRDTVWMSIHVPVIMVSYSVLALGVLFAHVQVFFMAMVPRRREIAERIDLLHYWYIHVGSILLLAGVVTGSMWGASSWGRYWGWDPKEVWSLVALLGYLTILHVRIDHDRVPGWAYFVGVAMMIAVMVIVAGRLAPLTMGSVLALGGTVVGMVVFVATRGAFANAIKSILCFWLIIMTYLGVNYVLGIGLHSYGFGTGAMARYMFLIGGIDLALVATLSLIHVVRLRLTASCSTDAVSLTAST